jgi:hypothetical protein
MTRRSERSKARAGETPARQERTGGATWRRSGGLHYNAEEFLDRRRFPLPAFRSCIRCSTVLVLALGILSWAPEAQAKGLRFKIDLKHVKTARDWCWGVLTGYGVDKAIDWIIVRATGDKTAPQGETGPDAAKAKGAGQRIDRATGEGFRQQLEKEIPRLVAEISVATGPERAALQESLEVHRGQLAVLTRLLSAQGEDIAAIRADQERLRRRIDDLESRVAALEGRVDRLDDRMDEFDTRLRQVEDALIRDCLDLRHAPVLGLDGYRIQETPGGWSSDRFDSSQLTLDLRLLLNSCSADLTRRGLVIQLAMVTRDLAGPLTLYVNWKGIGSQGYSGPRLLDRQEIPGTAGLQPGRPGGRAVLPLRRDPRLRSGRPARPGPGAHARRRGSLHPPRPGGELRPGPADPVPLGTLTRAAARLGVRR